ncbi:MAG: DNA polymerase III subunit alpha, partial [Chloroflexi bacterium]|nr:DNA polymerase III subunit alpha [Chloroflexota bacterium]
MYGYAELHCHSYYSLLNGASDVETLVARAAALGMPALALTDHDAVYGAVAFMRAAREHGIQPILGAELTLQGDAPATTYHLTLLVKDQDGWHNLCYLVSRARRNAAKGWAALPPEELVGCTNGLIALSGCRQGEIAAAILQDNWAGAVAAAQRYLELFGRENFFVELQRHRRPEEDKLVAGLAALARHLKLDCVATNNVHYATTDGKRLQDVMVCIRHHVTLDKAIHLRRFNSEYYLKSPQQMAELFADYPQAVTNTLQIANRCRFEFTYGLQDLPDFPTGGMSSSAFLRRLCEQGLRQRYTEPLDRARDRLRYELDVIDEAGLANYFLVVWDLVRYANEQRIYCQGRGSAASSLVAYVLYISAIDPLQHDLVFERFLSRERPVVPDIDLDLPSDRRDEVIDYVYERWGDDHVAMACTLVTYKHDSAVNDIAKALGLSARVAAAALETLENNQTPRVEASEQAPLQSLLTLCRQILGAPRHLGIHAGGMVLSRQPLMARLPTEPAAMAKRVVTQFDKDALAEVGLIKIDLLALRMLSAVAETVTLIAESTRETPTLEKLTFDDPAVYAMIGKPDTIGAFQIESRPQAQLLPKLKPKRFEDLMVAISLIRPGPIQGNMVRPYLRRRLGVEPVTYAHPSLEPVLAESLGVILYQEHVIQVAQTLAGFSGGQAEQLRRALGAKRAKDEIERFRQAFLTGAAAKGVPAAVAEAVFTQLVAFGDYSFAKSHAASFAVIVYWSAWLKKYYPAAFYVAILNHHPGYWPAASIVHETKRHNVPVRPVDIHRSDGPCMLEEGAIRIGLEYVKGLGAAQIERILECRATAPFSNLDDFCRRTRLGRRVVENLIMAGAMDSWAISRNDLLWELGTLRYEKEGLNLCLGFYTLGVGADVVCCQAPITKREASGKFGYRW